MLPILWTLAVPARWLPPALAAAAAAIVLWRAHAWRRQAAADGERVSWGAALWDDRVAVGAIALAAAALWRSGLLAGGISLPIHTYGVAIAAGFVVAVRLAQWQARRDGLDAGRVGDLAFWVLVAAALGSHLYFAAVNWPEYFGPRTWLVESPAAQRLVAAATFGAVDVRRVPRLLVPGGLVFYGGFLGASLAAFWYLRSRRMPFLPYADVVIPSVALGHFFGRLGCFAAGCCFGEPSSSGLPWLVRFPPASLAYRTLARRPDGASLLAAGGATTLPVHPVQLYEAAGELALFLVLALAVRPRRRFHGQLLATWLVAYAVLRTAVEAFRGDGERGVVAGLGMGQWTSIGIFAAGVAVWVAGRRGARPPAPIAAAVAPR